MEVPILIFFYQFFIIVLEVSPNLKFEISTSIVLREALELTSLAYCGLSNILLSGDRIEKI